LVASKAVPTNVVTTIPEKYASKLIPVKFFMPRLYFPLTKQDDMPWAVNLKRGDK
jgi:hypothetical protein